MPSKASLSSSFLAAGVLLGLWAGMASAQTTLQFQDGVVPTAGYAGTNDAVIKEQTPTLNLGNLVLNRVTTSELGGGRVWTLLRWDISGHVPPGCVVSEVRVRLYVDPDETGATNQLYSLERPWVEGNGTPGSGATWASYDGVNSWSSGGAEGGADRGSTVLANVSGGAGFQEVALNATGIARVQQWVDDPATNHGLILRGSSSDAVNYGAREDGVISSHPRLQVTFGLPPWLSGSGSVSLRQGVGGYAGASDTRLNANSANNNYGNNNTIRADSPRDWSLFRWTLSGIPSGATITSVNVDLFVSRVGGVFQLHQLLRDWDEGTATWNRPAAGQTWGSAGANQVGTDYAATPLGNVPNGPDETLVTSTLGAAGIAVVQGWLDTPPSNHGFIVRGTSTSRTDYSTSENSTNERPQLRIGYQLGGGTRTAVNPGSWSNPATWSPAGVPGPSERAVIQGLRVRLDGGGSHVVSRVDVGSGGTLEVSNGTLRVDGILALLNGAALELSSSGIVRALGRTKALPGSRLQLGGGALRLGALPCWLGAGSTFVATGGVVESDQVATPMDLTVHAQATLSGLTFRRPIAAGVRFSAASALGRLRGCRFEGIAGSAGAILLGIEQGRFCLNAPGNYFDTVGAGQYAVRIRDVDPSDPEDVAINFESRGAATNGPGATREDEQGGAAVNWVYSAPDTTAGVAVGFPQIAYDLNTFAYYATYAAFRNVNAAGTDRVYVFDPYGDGIDQGYWFDVPAAQGDIVGGYWWDQRGNARILWVLTTSGYVFRFTNPGSGSGAIPPDAGFPLQINDPSAVTFTTAPLTADQSLVFAGGTVAGASRFLALDAADGSLAWSVAGLTDPITSDLGSESQGGVTVLYAGGGQILNPANTLFNQTFNSNSGPFSYLDDTFRGTNSPTKASGNYVSTGGQSGGGLRVVLGTIGTNMSGGWRASFSVPGTSVQLVEIRFAYRLLTSSQFEFDEFQQILASVDGQLLGVAPTDYVRQFVGDGNGGPAMDSGWVTASFQRILTPGVHQLTLGGFANKSTEDLEDAQMFFDTVRIETIETQGRIYRINTQTQLVELEHVASGRISGSILPAFGSGLFAVDENGAVHGINQTTMATLSGWPVQTGTSLRSDVWLDYFSQQVYFGNESGQLFGYDIAGNPLPNWPLASPFGASDPVRASPLFDRGVLYAVNSRGRLVAVDASTGSVISPVYRFGGAGLSRVAQEYYARPMVTTSRGQFLVVDAISDPTP